MQESLFIGRDKELQICLDFQKEDVPWILVIMGMGGSGKTSLLQELKKQMPYQMVELDFAGEAQRLRPLKGERLPIDSLTRLSNFALKVRDKCDPQKYKEFHEELAKARKIVVKQRVPQYIGSLTQDVHLDSGATMTDNRVIMDTSEDPVMQDIRREARELVTEAFYALMDTYSPSRLVISLDTCEWLMGSVNAEIGLWMQELLLGLHSRMLQKNKRCHVFIASSVKLQLKAIAQQYRAELTLRMLDQEVVHQHLQSIGIQDAEIRQRIYEITHGHASCVSIICNLLLKEEKPLSIAELSTFQRRFYEEAVKDFIKEHILDERLNPHSPFYALTRYGIVLRSFNLHFLKKVFSEIFPDSLQELQAAECFDQFVERPYVVRLNPYEDHHYALLELLRAVLAEYIRVNESETWKIYHKRALAYLSSSMVPLSTEALLSAQYYHDIAYQLAGDKDPGVEYWEEELKKLEAGGTALNAWLQAAHDETLKFTSAAGVAQAYEQRRS